MKTGLRVTALAALGVILLLGGIKAAAGAIAVAVATMLVCLGLDGERGERIWLWLTLAAWTFVALGTWHGQTECGPEAPNHCAVGR